MFIYFYCSETIQKSMVPIDREAFRGWWEYLCIAAPNTLMTCVEFWAFEVVMIMSGIISIASLASLTICYCINIALIMVVVAFVEASSGIIGNCIGAQNVTLAKRFHSLITKAAILAILSECTILFFTRHGIVQIFTSDSEVMKLSE